MANFGLDILNLTQEQQSNYCDNSLFLNFNNSSPNQQKKSFQIKAIKPEQTMSLITSSTTAQQNAKNPNRNKKVKDLILDIRLQQQQQQQQQQVEQQHNQQILYENQQLIEQQHIKSTQQYLQQQQQQQQQVLLEQQHHQMNNIYNQSYFNSKHENEFNQHHLHQQQLHHNNHLMLNDQMQQQIPLISNSSSSKLITLNRLNQNESDLLHLINNNNQQNHHLNHSHLNLHSHQQQHNDQNYYLNSVANELLGSHHNQLVDNSSIIVDANMHNNEDEDDEDDLSSNSSISSTFSLQQQHQFHQQNLITNDFVNCQQQHQHQQLCCSTDTSSQIGADTNETNDEESYLLFNILNKINNNEKLTTSTPTPTNLIVKNDLEKTSPIMNQKPSVVVIDSVSYATLTPINNQTKATSSSASPSSSATSSSSTPNVTPNVTSPSSSTFLLSHLKQEKQDYPNIVDSNEYLMNSNKTLVGRALNSLINSDDVNAPCSSSSSSSSNSSNSSLNTNMMLMSMVTSEQNNQLILTPTPPPPPQQQIQTPSTPVQHKQFQPIQEQEHHLMHQSRPHIASPTNAQMEEINTKELAHRISSELKRYSIPQAVFAQRVLCRSQGTLSDLLRNPKPWSKLKSGRETFRRMYKWLQEPESYRMNALRAAGNYFFQLFLIIEFCLNFSIFSCH